MRRWLVSLALLLDCAVLILPGGQTCMVCCVGGVCTVTGAGCR